MKRYCIHCNTSFEETEDTKYPIFCKGCQKEVWFIETKKSTAPAKMVFVPAKSGEKNMKKKICPTCGQEIKAQSKKELRIKALKELGIDLNSCFSLSFDDGETINQSDFNDSVSSVITNEYINTPKLFRRWIMAQTFRLLGEDNDSWTYNFNSKYNYMYQFKMLLEETKVLAKLEKTKDETYFERSFIFTSEIIANVVQDYINKLKQLVKTQKVHKCKGRSYVKVGRNIFCDKVETKVFEPFNAVVNSIKNATSYSQIYNALKDFTSSPYFVKIEAKKTWEFTDAFKKAGCFYTMMNLFQFHHCVIKGHNTEQSIQYIKYMLKDCYGYEFLGLLKDVVAYNNFSFKNRMKEIYSK